MPPKTLTGHCYCGKIQVSADRPPLQIAYCHCSDCRRVTGAPVAAFAAFEISAVTLTPDVAAANPLSEKVKRRFCPSCGSPLTAEFDYLPGQIYVPLGLLDQADDLPPELHCHSDSALKWLHIQDDTERVAGTARDILNQ
ncbi:MAG: GFA family protein [Pseudomonadota bacterium]